MMAPAVKIIQDFPSPTAYKYNEDVWQQQHGNSFVIINCVASNIYYPEHWTPLSMKCVLAGKEFYQFSNFSYAVTQNRFLLLNEGSQYASYIDSDFPSESFTLNFTRENIAALSSLFFRNTQNILDDPFCSNNPGLRFIEKLYEYNPAILSKIYFLKQLVDEDQTDHAAITEKLYEVLYELLLLDRTTRKAIGKIKSKKASTREEIYKRLSIARDYMESCYNENITLEKMARTCYMNPFYLLREFKKNFHVTPHQYLILARLREARRLIITTDKPITAIVAEVGFETHSSFSRSYKKHFGFSPLAHRSTFLSGTILRDERKKILVA